MITIEPISITIKGYAHNANISKLKLGMSVNFMGKKYTIESIEDGTIKAYSIENDTSIHASIREKTKITITEQNVTIQQTNDNRKVYA